MMEVLFLTAQSLWTPSSSGPTTMNTQQVRKTLKDKLNFCFDNRLQPILGVWSKLRTLPGGVRKLSTRAW